MDFIPKDDLELNDFISSEKYRFLILYSFIEELDHDYDIRTFVKRKSIITLAKGLQGLDQSKEFCESLAPDRERFDLVIELMAIVFKLYGHYGPGEVGRAWVVMEKSYRQLLGKRAT